VEDAGMTKSYIGSVITSKAASDGCKVGNLVSIADKGQDFLEDISLILNVADDPRTGSDVAVVPTLQVYRIDAEKLEVSVFEFVVDSVNHAMIFELKEAAARSGKNERWEACVAEGEQLHLAAEQGGEPSLIFALQTWGPLC
jgi:hypothetical protein